MQNHAITVLPRITPQGSYFFEVVEKGRVIRGGSYSRDGELLFRAGYFAKRFTFSIQMGISYDDANGMASGNSVLQHENWVKNALTLTVATKNVSRTVSNNFSNNYGSKNSPWGVIRGMGSYFFEVVKKGGVIRGRVIRGRGVIRGNAVSYMEGNRMINILSQLDKNKNGLTIPFLLTRYSDMRAE